MTEFQFNLADRIQKIQSINQLYDLEYNSYISFSGGKDSSVLSALFDLALPKNEIPRVYINTGIEYKMMIQHVERERERDARIVVIQPTQNIKEMLESVGYPFKSKEHSMYLSIFQNSGYTKTITRYLNRGNYFECPSKLKYQFTDEYKIKTSSKCCSKLKKEPASIWAKENNKTITITGMRSSEGGLRAEHKGCTVFAEDKTLKKFHPLQPIDDSFIDEFIKTFNIQLCELYYPPFNFKRTGCKGCPYSLNLEEQLEIMSYLLPEERKQCEYIWKPVYEEYRRIGYRLHNEQPLLF